MESQHSDYRLYVPTNGWLSTKRPYNSYEASQSAGPSTEGTPKKLCTLESNVYGDLSSNVDCSEGFENLAFGNSCLTQLPTTAFLGNEFTYELMDTTTMPGETLNLSVGSATDPYFASTSNLESQPITPWTLGQTSSCTRWDDPSSFNHAPSSIDNQFVFQDPLIAVNPLEEHLISSCEQTMQWEPPYHGHHPLQSPACDTVTDDFAATKHESLPRDVNPEQSGSLGSSSLLVPCSWESSSANHVRPCSTPEKLDSGGDLRDIPPLESNPDNSEIAATEAHRENTDYDACLGLLLLDDLRLHWDVSEAKQAKAIKLEVRNDLIIIRNQESSSYEGMVGQGAGVVIRDLLDKFKVRLDGTITGPAKVELLLYSRCDSVSEIGTFLSARDWFLQAPDSYDLSTTYHNPHWLLRPGTEMVPLDHVNVAITQAQSLTANEKSRVADILDSATGPVVVRDVEVSGLLTTNLKRHQKKALSMMFEKESGSLQRTEFPSLWVEQSDTNTGATRYQNAITMKRISRRPQICLGGLLADDMGLGKTPTALALIASSLEADNLGALVAPGPTLIVAPLSTLPGWEHQLEVHFKHGQIKATTYHGSARKKNAISLANHHIVLTTYETVRAEGTNQRDTLHSIQWYRIVLDEAHVIRNRESKTFSTVQRINAQHRWCLTGSPIQNTLEDLSSIVQFLQVHPFDNPSSFRECFIGSSKSWERLRSLIQCIAIRRTKKSMEDEIAIPPRRDVEQLVHLDSSERQLYNLVKRYFALSIDTGGSKMNAFSLILRLRQISNHGKDLLPQSLRDWLDKASLFGDAEPPRLRDCEVCGAQDVEEILPCLHQVCSGCIAQASGDTKARRPICLLCDASVSESFQPSCTTEGSTLNPSYRPSSKVKALLQNLQADLAESNPPWQSPAKRHVSQSLTLPTGRTGLIHHSVVFSQWTSMLDFIGNALSCKGIGYQRLDGSRTLPQRRQALSEFRTHPSCQVLLATLGSAGIGLDLTLASRVHIIEPGWNPMLERQAIDRIHRLGQTREVVSFAYVTAGKDSVEAYIRRKQKWKMEMIAASIGHGDAEDLSSMHTLLKDFREELGVDLEVKT